MTGENNCEASWYPKDATCCTQGFSALPGWDPVTGFGSVNFDQFAAVFGVIIQNSNDSNNRVGLIALGVAGGIISFQIIMVAVMVHWREDVIAAFKSVATVPTTDDGDAPSVSNPIHSNVQDVEMAPI